MTRRRHQKEEKIEGISGEKGAPTKTTKQTVTGQKAHEKSLNGTYRLQRRNTISISITIKNKSPS